MLKIDATAYSAARLEEMRILSVNLWKISKQIAFIIYWSWSCLLSM